MRQDNAMIKSNFDRVDNDFYPTPKWCVDALMDTAIKNASHFPMTFPIIELWNNNDRYIWEPAVGKGSIINALKEKFDGEYEFHVTASDVEDYGYPDTEVKNFFQYDKLPLPYIDMIITNPPYDKAEAFVRHALKLSSEKCNVVMLLRNEWDCAKSRIDLFNNSCFFGKVVLTSRPKWIAGSTGSPRHNYAWYIWRGDISTEPSKIFYAEKPS